MVGRSGRLNVEAFSNFKADQFTEAVLGCFGAISAPAAGLSQEQLAAASRLQKIMARVDGCSGGEQGNARFLLERELELQHAAWH